MAVMGRGISRQEGGDGNEGKRTKKTDIELVRAGQLRNKGVNLEQINKGERGRT
jgi:hypothetical protein